MTMMIRHIAAYLTVVLFLLSASGITLYDHSCASCGVHDLHWFAEGDCHSHGAASHEHSYCDSCADTESCTLTNNLLEHAHNQPNGEETKCHQNTEHQSESCCENTAKNFKISQPYIATQSKAKIADTNVPLIIHLFSESTLIFQNNSPKKTSTPPLPYLAWLAGSESHCPAFNCCFLL